jgi:dCTP deaminase
MSAKKPAGDQMIINGSSLLKAKPIVGMLTTKIKDHGVSHGLSEAGYDIRLKQDIEFIPGSRGMNMIRVDNDNQLDTRFTLASAIEEFQMPNFLVGRVHDKSSWARQGVSVFNTIIEPGWKGFLTLEIVFHGNKPVHIPAGSGIAQVIFETIINPTEYAGKYQFQDNRPVPAIMDKG